MNLVKTTTKCPHCKRDVLTAVMLNGNATGYYCCACSSQFTVNSHFNPISGKVTTVANRLNPKYQEAMDSNDWMENMEKDLKMRKAGVPLYTNSYVVRVDDAK